MWRKERQWRWLLHLWDQRLGLITQSFLVLSSSKPNLAMACWLCYDTAPPYYKGVAIMGTFNQTSDSTQCWWRSIAQLTLQQMAGPRTCIGTSPGNRQFLSNSSQAIPPRASYLIPHNDTWWVCCTNLPPPSIHTLTLSSTKGFCMLAHLIPRFINHAENKFLEKIGELHPGLKETTTLTLSILLGASLVGMGTGTVSLVT